MEFSTSIKILHQQAKLRYSVLIQDKSNQKTYLKTKTKVIGLELISCGFPISGIVIDFGIIKQSIKQVISLLDQKFLLGLSSRYYKTSFTEDSVLIETNFEEIFEFPKEICVITLEDNLQGKHFFSYIGRLLQENLSSQGIPTDGFKFLISKSDPTTSTSFPHEA